ncbi:hypothetical protein HFP57_12985 [Parasphingopyxis algicola]|uniref:hypothetical protein n=1 Tax=Parasphingopyxis algicola TaxID=2026624 RepID=UPI0015A3B4FA|nr:hypothetical protein [Parasphingopyxis algicola]QLC25846.1 hypothetical protein HFP57_12985 [Parasphingopyxis algicola]
MTVRVWSAMALAPALFLALTACAGEAGDGSTAEPAALALTPGAWAADDERASYADEDGALLASFRCDAETAELVLEMPGGVPDGGRPAMLLRAGDFMHGVDPVEIRTGADGPVRLARLPVAGPLAGTIRGFPAPLTVESDGGEPVMIQTDAVLQEFFEQCAAAAGGSAPINGGQ